MGGLMIDIDFKFPNWKKKLKAYEKALNLFVAATVQTNRGMLFDAEGAHNAHPKWASLKFRNGMILSKRGTLRKSIAPYNPRGIPGPDGIVRFAGDVITIGTKLIYARLMNDGTEKMPGGVLRPKNAKALKIPLPAGKAATPLAKTLRKTAKTLQYSKDGVTKTGKFIFVKSVKIPARPFDKWNDADQNELNAALVNKIAEILGVSK